MKNIGLVRCIKGVCMLAGALFLSMTAEAGNTHLSVNIGVPVVAAPPPPVVYSAPVVPVGAAVSVAPVVVYRFAQPRPLLIHRHVPHVRGGGYHGRSYGPHRGRR